MAGPKILICEGEGIVALDLQKSLHDMGYQAPVVVSTAKEAIEESALSMNPDLVLTGTHLQRKRDGIEAVEEISGPSECAGHLFDSGFRYRRLWNVRSVLARCRVPAQAFSAGSGTRLNPTGPLQS